jgi:hypothetical protein
MRGKIRLAVLTFAGIVEVAAFFFGTLYVLGYPDNRAPDTIRADNAKVIIAALEKYHAAKGSYPILPVPDSRIKELAGPLAEFLRPIPIDPEDAEPTHYVSFDGKSFGLWLHQKPGPCIVEVKTSKTGWWGQPPPCNLSPA